MTIRDTFIAQTRSWVGTPNHHQAALKGVGCDCLGLVRGIWRAVYGADPEHPPAYSRDWAETLREETLAFFLIKLKKSISSKWIGFLQLD